MEKHFLTVLHEGEIMNEMSLDMLKGGIRESEGCSPNNCGCYKGNGCIGKNEVPPTRPDTIVVQP